MKKNINHKSSINPIEQFSNPKLKWDYDLKPGSVKIWCPKCKKIIYMNKKRYTLELKAFESKGMKWCCKACRTIDVRSIIQSTNSF